MCSDSSPPLLNSIDLLRLSRPVETSVTLRHSPVGREVSWGPGNVLGPDLPFPFRVSTVFALKGG